MQQITVYGDSRSRTICVRGDIELTHWATICGEDDRDVVVISDGTVLEVVFEYDTCKLKVLAEGKALSRVQVGGPWPGDDEATLEGEIKWVMVAFKTEFANLEQKTEARTPA